MTRKHGLFASAVAFLLTVMLAVPANAQREREREENKECKTEVMTSSGDAKFRPFTRTRELNCRGAAAAAAIGNWQREVNAKFGEQWIQWDKAQLVDPITGQPPAKSRNGEYEQSWCKCSPARPGTLGGLFIRCTVTAKPCGGTPEKVVEETKEGGTQRQCSEFPQERIRDAQRLLNCYCKKEVSVDGQCGPTTIGCLKDFQGSRTGREAGLEVDGRPTRKTVDALRDYCRK